MDRRTFLKVAAATAATIAAAGPASAAKSPFVRRSGTRFTLGGTRWRLFGGSTYGTVNPGASETIDGTISLAQEAGLNTLRLVNFLDESGTDPQAPYDPASWARVDAMLAAMQDAGLKAILDLSTYRNYLQNLSLATASSVTPYQRNWLKFLRFVAHRKNTITGVRTSDDPTIAIVSFAGEPNPPNSGEPLKPTTKQLTKFYERVFGQWKSLDVNHLVSSGGLLHIDWEELYGNPAGSGIDYVAIFSLAHNDVPSIHNYWNTFPPSAATDFKTPKIADLCAQIQKPWITEEFGFLQAQPYGTTDDAYTDTDRAAWFQIVYDIQRHPSPIGVAAAGESFWNLGNEVAADSYDVNPDTPATWAAVQANAP